MRTLLAAALTSLFVLGSLTAFAGGPKAKRQAPTTPSAAFSSPEQVLRWINGYRHEPEPQRLPAAVRAMSDLGLFRDLDTAGIHIGFIAGVLGSRPEEAGRLVVAMFPLPPEEQAVIVKAIAYSGIPEWKQLLNAFIERMPGRRKLIDKYLFGKEPTLMALALDSGPGAIDALWGFYFATGSALPVMRITTALPWAAEKSDVNKLTIGSMAKWTLASNASRDKDLLDLARDEAARKDQKPEIAKALNEIVEAAETYETAKIRKDAVAAIEELKRKGPVKEWSWSTFGVQAAPTVIALGCVAASVTGQAEIGIPCVLSGALSTAVSKMWTGSP